MNAQKVKKKRNTYYVTGYDERIGYIEGDTTAYSPNQAATFLAIRSGVPRTEKYRLRYFIENANVVLLNH